VAVEHGRAVRTTRKLGREERTLTGVSTDAVLAASAAVARERPNELVVVLPDTGERSLSTGLLEPASVSYWEGNDPAHGR